MESPKPPVFAYKHNAFDVDNSDRVEGHNHHKMDGFDHFGYTVAHCLQRFVAQILSILVRIAVVGIATAMVVTPHVVARY